MLQPFKNFFKKNYLKLFFSTLIFIVVSIVLCNFWIIKSTETQLYNEITNIPENDIALFVDSHRTHTKMTVDRTSMYLSISQMIGCIIAQRSILIF